jgi:hypothetical protein
MPEAPARNGATARMIPMKRPMRIALGPWRSKNASICASRACETPRRGPCSSRNRRPEATAEQERDQVAARRRQPDERKQDGELHLALGRHHAAEDDGRLPRRDEADEGAGLQERQGRDEAVGPRAERLGEVLERALEVRELDDPGGHRRERRGGQDRDGDERQRRPRAALARDPGGGRASRGHRAAPRRPSGPRGGAAARGPPGRAGPGSQTADGAVGPDGRERQVGLHPKASRTPTIPPLAAPGSGSVLATWPTK